MQQHGQDDPSGSPRPSTGHGGPAAHVQVVLHPKLPGSPVAADLKANHPRILIRTWIVPVGLLIGMPAYSLLTAGAAAAAGAVAFVLVALAGALMIGWAYGAARRRGAAKARLAGDLWCGHALGFDRGMGRRHRSKGYNLAITPSGIRVRAAVGTNGDDWPFEKLQRIDVARDRTPFRGNGVLLTAPGHTRSFFVLTDAAFLDALGQLGATMVDQAGRATAAEPSSSGRGRRIPRAVLVGVVAIVVVGLGAGAYVVTRPEDTTEEFCSVLLVGVDRTITETREIDLDAPQAGAAEELSGARAALAEARDLMPSSAEDDTVIVAGLGLLEREIEAWDATLDGDTAVLADYLEAASSQSDQIDGRSTMCGTVTSFDFSWAAEAIGDDLPPPTAGPPTPGDEVVPFGEVGRIGQWELVVIGAAPGATEFDEQLHVTMEATRLGLPSGAPMESIFWDLSTAGDSIGSATASTFSCDPDGTGEWEPPTAEPGATVEWVMCIDLYDEVTAATVVTAEIWYAEDTNISFELPGADGG
jgi:hypothetical protein